MARADREVQEKFLLRNGADEVVNPEKQIARWTAIRFTSSYILDYIKIDDDHAIFEVKVPAEWVGLQVKELEIRQKFGINIMAIKENGDMNVTVSPDDILRTVLVENTEEGFLGMAVLRIRTRLARAAHRHLKIVVQQ